MTIPVLVLNTLYVVIGIGFGVGFSLIISSVYRDIRNCAYRKDLRDNLRQVRERFVFYFFVSTIIYLFFSLFDRSKASSLLAAICNNWEQQGIVRWIFCHYHLSETALWSLVVVLLVYVRNYIALQQINEDIDEELAKK